MLSDIEIARNAVVRKIADVAKELGLQEDDYELYGKYKAKISGVSSPRKGKLILVTAMTPTKQGDGKTTISIGLADGLRKIGKNSILALREPSLGPVFAVFLLPFFRETPLSLMRKFDKIEISDPACMR